MTLEIPGLRKAIANALAKTVKKYESEVNRVIESETEFGDLGFAGQDIVDTGRLRDSLIISIRQNQGNLVSEHTFSWEPRNPENDYPYAPSVWAGFFPFGGTTYVPGRHWDTRAAQNIDLVSDFAKNLSDNGIKVVRITNNIDKLP